MTDPAPKRYWLDDPRNVNRVHRILIIACVLLVAADLFYEKHLHFRLENFWGSYALMGFVSYVSLVLTAKQLRKLLRRDESYYD